MALSLATLLMDITDNGEYRPEDQGLGGQISAAHRLEWKPCSHKAPTFVA
jgi:hypothetical protein